ncbi:MAG: tetratricopeptide repeat protein [Calothrix sp. MO_167.B12]|nr:tetratricopeptide repeat protein [Calothrix sp. MO_167.B12]
MLGNILVGRYQIISHLGGGGFGETFVAFDTQLPGKPKCVVKKLKPQSRDPITLQTARRLFDTEAQVLYKLGNYKYIPQLLAYFEENQEFYLVQEFITGHDLSQELAPGKKWSQEEVITFLRALLEILEFIHQQNVIHRDINPRNILRDAGGKLILIDFGAVKEITTQAIINSGEIKQTIAIGTPGYIPSEQAQGSPKFSSDIYAVGIIGIQALTGLEPSQLSKDTITNEIVWREEAQVTPELAHLLDKMVCYDFRERYSSATQVLQIIQDLQLNHQTSNTIAISPISTPNKQKLKLFSPSKGIIIKLFLLIVFIVCAGVGSMFLFNAINANNANALYRQANILADLQRYEDALSVYDRAINLKSNYSQAWYGKGKSLYALKKYKQALVAYDKAIQIQPDYWLAWNGRGLILDKLQRYQEAIAAFDRALQIQPEQPDIWATKGKALVKLKQYDEAIMAYDQAISLKSDNYNYWYEKGLVLHKSQLYEDAIASFERSLEIKSNHASSWYHRGNALVNLRRYDDAINSYDKAVEYQANFYQAWLSKGNILVILRKYPEAVISFKQVVKYSPRNSQGWYYLGWSLHQNQRYEEAINSFNRAISLKRNSYQSWYAKGNSLYQLTRYPEAIKSYNRAVYYKKNHYESWYSKGNSLFNLQQYQQAIVAYKQALKYKPDYQQAKQALQQTQELLADGNNDKE